MTRLVLKRYELYCFPGYQDQGTILERKILFVKSRARKFIKFFTNITIKTLIETPNYFDKLRSRSN